MLAEELAPDDPRRKPPWKARIVVPKVANRKTGVLEPGNFRARVPHGKVHWVRAGLMTTEEITLCGKRPRQVEEWQQARRDAQISCTSCVLEYRRQSLGPRP